LQHKKEKSIEWIHLIYDIGTVYLKEGPTEFDHALNNYQEALKLCEKLKK